MRFASLISGLISCFLLIGCSLGLREHESNFDEIAGRGGPRRSLGVLSVRYRKSLAPELEGSLEPVERAAPFLDSTHELVIVGSSTGWVYGFDGTGRERFALPLGAGVASEPLVAEAALFVASDEEFLFAYDRYWQGNSANRFRVRLPGPLVGAMTYRDGVIFLVTETNHAVALDARTGETRWTFSRDLPEGFATSTHASLTVVGDRVFVAMSDGTVSALDVSDGSVQWQFDSTEDLETGTSDFRVTDVDTTPVLMGNQLWVASALGGLYALDVATGAVVWRRAEYQGVIGIQPLEGGAILASGEFGIARVDAEQGELVWSHAFARGAVNADVAVAGGYVLATESRGGIVALDLERGVEVDRLEDGHGFSSSVRVAATGGHGEHLCAALSNAGTLFVMDFATHLRERTEN